ncbi:hypothetical protein Tco_0898852 [Tanacetum coccineum]
MRQRRRIKLFRDYDCEIRYHPGKENVVDDALSRKKRIKPKRIRSMNMTLQSCIKSKILAAQEEASDEITRLQRGLDEMTECRSDGALYYLDRIWVPLKGDVRTLIMDEAHKLKYSIHPKADKMYSTLEIAWICYACDGLALSKYSSWQALGAGDLGVATPKALVYAGVMTSTGMLCHGVKLMISKVVMRASRLEEYPVWIMYLRGLAFGVCFDLVL